MNLVLATLFPIASISVLIMHPTMSMFKVLVPHCVGNRQPVVDIHLGEKLDHVHAGTLLIVLAEDDIRARNTRLLLAVDRSVVIVQDVPDPHLRGAPLFGLYFPRPGPIIYLLTCCSETLLRCRVSLLLEAC